MSFQAMTAVQTVKGISPTARLVLFILAQYAGADGLCHPSQATLAEDTGLSERGIRNAIAELKKAGIIDTARRVRKNGSRTSDQIQLLYYTPKEAVEEGARLANPGKAKRHEVPVHIEGDNRHVVPDANRHEMHDLPARGAGPTTFEPVSESLSQSASASEGDAGFEEGLGLYPASGRGVTDEAAARTLWLAAVAEVGEGARLVAAVRAYAADPSLKRREYGSPSMQRWLAERRWVAWLPATGSEPSRAADSAVGSARADAVWGGPAEVAEIVAGAMGGPAAVASYLSRAGWDGEGKVVLAATRYAAGKLVEEAGAQLGRIGVRIEVAHG